MELDFKRAALSVGRPYRYSDPRKRTSDITGAVPGTV